MVANRPHVIADTSSGAPTDPLERDSNRRRETPPRGPRALTGRRSAFVLDKLVAQAMNRAVAHRNSGQFWPHTSSDHTLTRLGPMRFTITTK
jgi:hypothetical protein